MWEEFREISIRQNFGVSLWISKIPKFSQDINVVFYHLAQNWQSQEKHESHI